MWLKKKIISWKKKLSTGEFYSLAVDDEVRQLLGDLSALLLVLREVKLLTQLHVKHLQAQLHTEWRKKVVLLKETATYNWKSRASEVDQSVSWLINQADFSYF